MFTSAASSFLSSFFNAIIQLFNITVPGTSVTFFQIGIGVLITIIVIGIAHQFTNFGISSASGFMSKGGNNKKIKVSKERSKDTK